MQLQAIKLTRKQDEALKRFIDFMTTTGASGKYEEIRFIFNNKEPQKIQFSPPQDIILTGQAVDKLPI